MDQHCRRPGGGGGGPECELLTWTNIPGGRVGGGGVRSVSY